MCFCVTLVGIFILVYCELPTSQPMGKTRETSDVSNRMLVPISLEVLHDCFKGDDNVSLCYCLQSRTVYLHRLTLGAHDNLDTLNGKKFLSFKSKYYQAYFLIPFERPLDNLKIYQYLFSGHKFLWKCRGPKKKTLFRSHLQHCYGTRFYLRHCECKRWSDSLQAFCLLRSSYDRKCSLACPVVHRKWRK